MSFEHPGLFVLLLIIPLLLVGAILANHKRSSKWRRLIAARLLPILVRERSQVMRWISFGIFLLGLIFLIGSLAAPNAGFREAPETIRGRNILLAVDVSKSMLATDETPTRLGSARAAALELLDRFPNDRVGVIAFSGVAWLQAPLTVDHNAVREVFQQLEFQDTANEWIPRSGSDISVAVELAVKTFRETGQRDNALIILSDGESHEGSVEAAAESADEAGVTIFTVGFGSDHGSFLPDAESRDGKLHDREGNLVLTRLRTEDLQLLARRTGGLYTAGSGQGFSATLRQAVERLEQYELEGRNRRTAIPRFQWFLVPAMVLFILGMLLNSSWRFASRSATAVLAGLLVFSLPSEAGFLPRTKAEQAFQDGDHQKALALFEKEVASARGERQFRLRLGEAAAAYRLGNFGHASRAFSGALLSKSSAVQEQAHFGLGNTEFCKGLLILENASNNPQAPHPQALEETALHWRDAISHFEGALALNPDNQNARANRDHVKKRLQELLKELEKQEQEQAQNDQNQEANPDQNEDPENSKDKGEEPKESGESPDDSRQTPPDSNGEKDPDDPAQTPPDPSEQGDPDKRDPEQGEEQAPPGDEPLEQKPGETPEEYARRILSDNADFQEKPLPLRFRNLPRPRKDW